MEFAKMQLLVSLNKNIFNFCLAQPGDSCAENQVCVGNSNCVSGKCVCPPGMVIKRLLN